MTTYDCLVLGHVLVGNDDPECLCCGAITVEGDKTIHIERNQGELQDPRDIAGPNWGPVG